MATRNGNINLQSAMALLIQNQAALAVQHTKFLDRWAETRQILVRIENDLDAIKAILVRHGAMLEKLPEAIREKIGFKGQ